MFKARIFIPLIIFLLLLVIISITKNQTRIIEKKLYKLNKKITLKEQDINETQLDFYFLTSPAEIEKKIEKLGLHNYTIIENSKIFLSSSYLTKTKNKISILKNYDKKATKKN